MVWRSDMPSGYSAASSSSEGFDGSDARITSESERYSRLDTAAAPEVAEEEARCRRKTSLSWPTRSSSASEMRTDRSEHFSLPISDTLQDNRLEPRPTQSLAAPTCSQVNSLSSSDSLKSIGCAELAWLYLVARLPRLSISIPSTAAAVLVVLLPSASPQLMNTKAARRRESSSLPAACAAAVASCAAAKDTCAPRSGIVARVEAFAAAASSIR
mmetsp:Transcript_30216/g.60673  ORF Transcript_30216/g.60673 Transcript_30216/m.60673 type:complete len:214 (-) Transcript_30216:388-1029(-)